MNRRKIRIVISRSAETATVYVDGGVLAKKGDKNASGYLQTGNVGMSVVAKGNVERGYLWLGFTFIHKGGWEEDKDVVKVRKDFKKYYTVGTGAITEGKIDYVASLWRWKVDIGDCKSVCVYCRDRVMHKEHKYEPCKWCKKKGYHMEDRVDSQRGTWEPSM